MQKQNLIVVVLLIFSLSMRALEVSPRDYSIVPPAPEVASIMDFKDYPVDYFRGIPSISFPIYTIKSGSIEVPIVLSYHGGGIRANQKIGNAGLGWSVMCGSVISHTVYGAPDDANESSKLHGFYHLNSDEEMFRQKLIEKEADYAPTDGSRYKNIGYWQATLGNSYYEGRADIANDIYNLSGYNMSATFVRDKGGKIILSSDNPIQISSTTDIPNITDGGCDGWGFLITDNKGVKYEFITQDRTRYDYNYGSPLLTQAEDSIYYASAWHLDRISDLRGNSVSFSYRKREGRLVKDLGHLVSRGFSNPNARPYNMTDVFSLSSLVYYPQIIEEVEANGIKVKFTYAHEGTTTSEALIKTIDISAPSGEHRIYTFNYNYNSNLLLSIEDGDQTIYTFDYNLDWGTDIYKSCQDFGGYINENITNSLIPIGVFGDLQLGRGADRSVSKDYSKSLVLTKVTYPTGGYTEFDWENNTFRYLKSVEYSGKINSDMPVLKVVTDTIRYCEEAGYSKLKILNWHVTETHSASIDLSKYFLMNPANLYMTSYEDSHKSDVYTENNPPYYPHIVIRNHNTGNIEKVYYLDKETIETEALNQPISLHLSPGYYDFELINPIAIQGEEDFLRNYFRYNDSPAGYIYLCNTTYEATGDGREYWCGLRIRRIKSSTGDPDDCPLIKYYYYNTARDPLYTTGTVQLLPKYDYRYYMVYSHPDMPGYADTEVYCMTENSFPNTPLGSFSNIEYPQVLMCMGREDGLEPDGYLNYMAESFHYSSARTISNCDYNNSKFLPYQPVGAQMYTSQAHKRGNLEKHCILNSYNSVKTEEYFYTIYESPETPVLTTNAFVVCDFTRAPGINQYGGYDYGIGVYSLIPYNKTVNCVRTIEADGIETYKTFEYFYDSYSANPDYDLIKSIREKDVSGLETTTYYTYPVKNGIKLPFPETEVVLCGAGVMSAVRTEYDEATNLPIRKYNLSNSCSPIDLISTTGVTSSSQISKIDNPTLSYKYNSKGNLIEISYKNEVLASYIWGYNGLFPIIEAIGVDYDNLVAAAMQAGLTATQIAGMEVADDAKISSIAKTLRSRLLNETISSISYDWFYGQLRFTDGRGIDTSNTYDSQGRLTAIKDFNNYLISKYEYHYVSNK